MQSYLSRNSRWTLIDLARLLVLIALAPMARRKHKETVEPGVKLVATNRRASFDYELGERYEAGLVLLGSEVKSLRNRAAGIGEAWATIRNGEAFLEGMRISVLDHAAYGHTNERRTRKLLLNRREIEALRNAIERGGLNRGRDEAVLS